MTMEPAVVCIAFYIEGTGLTRVMEMLAGQFSQHYKIHYIGVGYQGPVIESEKVTIYPTNQRGGDIMGAYQARDLIAEQNPEFVFVLHDLWHFDRYMSVFQEVRTRSKFIAYVPLDGEIVDPRTAEALMGLDMVVLYTPWARDQVSGAFERLDGKMNRQRPLLEVAYHGVELAHFYPMEGRDALRAEVFPGLGEDAFVVLNASRPCIRKRVDLTLRGFAEFAQGKPDDVKLCLHQAIKEEESESLLRLAEELGIEDRVIANPLRERAMQGDVLTDADLNLLYNGCDVGINTSMGEGWGLVSFEHAATGAAQIVPAHSACEFLWRDVAVMLKTRPPGIPQISPLGMREPVVASVVDALEKLYEDRDYRDRVSVQCRTLALQDCYRWESVAEVWRGLLQKLSSKG